MRKIFAIVVLALVVLSAGCISSKPFVEKPPAPPKHELVVRYLTVSYPTEILDYEATVRITDSYSNVESIIYYSYNGIEKTGTYSFIELYKNSTVERETGGWMYDDDMLFEYYTNLRNNTTGTINAKTDPLTPTIELNKILDPYDTSLLVEVPHGFRWRTYGDDTITGTMNIIDSTRAKLTLKWICCETDDIGNITADVTIHSAKWRTIEDDFTVTR